MDNNDNTDSNSYALSNNKSNKTISSEKSDVFKQAAEKQVNKILKEFELLSELAAKHKGGFNDNMVDSMFKVIKDKLNSSKKVFKDQKEEQDFKF